MLLAGIFAILKLSHFHYTLLKCRFWSSTIFATVEETDIRITSFDPLFEMVIYPAVIG